MAGALKIAASRPRSKGTASCSKVRSIAGFVAGLEPATGAEFLAGDRGAVRDATVAADGVDRMAGVSRTAGRLDASSAGFVGGGTAAGVRKLSFSRSMPSIATVEPSKSNIDRSIGGVLEGRRALAWATFETEGTTRTGTSGVDALVGGTTALDSRRAINVGTGLAFEAECGARDAAAASVEAGGVLAFLGLAVSGANGSAGSARTPAKASSKASELEASWWMAAGSNRGVDCEAADEDLGDATNAIAGATMAVGCDATATAVASAADDGVDATEVPVAMGAGDADTATSVALIGRLVGNGFGRAARISGGSSAAGPLTGFDGTANSSGTPR